MTQPLLIDRQRAALRDLVQSAAARAHAEEAVEAAFRAEAEAAEQEFRDRVGQVNARYEAERGAAEQEFQQAREAVVARFDAGREQADREHAVARQKTSHRFETDKDKAETEYEEARWAITTLLEGSKKGAGARLDKAKLRARAGTRQAGALRDEARALVRSWGRLREVAEQPVPHRPFSFKKDPFKRMDRGLTVAGGRLAGLKGLSLPRWFKGNRLPALVAVLWLISLAPAWFVPWWYYWAAGATLAAVLLYLFCRTWLYGRARARVAGLYRPLCYALDYAEAACRRGHDDAARRHKRAVAAATRRCHRDLRRADKKYKPLLAEIQRRHDDDLRRAGEEHDARRAAAQQARDGDWRRAEDKYHRLVTAATDRFEADSRQAEEDRARRLADARRAHEDGWRALTEDWHQGLARVRAAVAEVQEECRRLFPEWSDPVWDHWSPAQAVPPGIRFGRLQVRMDQVPHGVPAAKGLRAPEDFALPAVLPFPAGGSLLVKAADAGRDRAVELLQAVMLRFLTALPPGKVRFTILDPVGLGENFAAFMHLADHDDALVTSKIWAEASHVERRLADLTEHMGNVIQKYLRNQYQTIEEYNAQAGEVAEPYRVLVVANFPAGFTPEAARRLVSVVTSGAGCGVCTLLSVDAKQPLPQGFNLKDLEGPSLNLAWKDGRFAWKDPDFGPFALAPDAPPGADFFLRILQQVGEKARAARRVEVRFDFVAPPPEQWWTGDSRPGLRVALGRAGATRRQLLQLGQGTAQHVLIAGKTGSGKSTLLHALVTNLALLYSPAEVELYLVDFKKGVEFKTYAVHELPHARVVAIESEREFGLSVLQRLDAELKARGDRFRQAGVHDLAGYRQADGAGPCPRILLIVDEFQEFFVEDDKIAQEAALLLDRLVRQGRAFGLHVLLGSQTLGGAYTLARSTIDQMAVRIALQCSEADAHLILSKDNAAARLLSRPGEAIYNDANGLVEGNDLFQVVWLPDDRREDYLRRLREMARERDGAAARPQIVFEGNAPADVARNPLLHRLLAEPGWPAPPRAAHAWLGEAVAIKDPTAAVFRPQSASNLLLLGQQAEPALGILAAALVSLAAQHPPGDEHTPLAGSRFYVLDGSPVDAPGAGSLARLAEALPHPVRVAGWRDLPAVVAELADELARREQAPDAEAPAWYLVVYGLHWFRDLRRSEDDFGFSRREERPSPAKQFATVLREGPGVRVHSLAWCDTLANAQRSFDRQGLREFEMRVLFQMSAADSSNLIDSPLASKLGVHRALFHSEDRAAPEKFRPYGPPPGEWLAWVRQRLGARQTQLV